MLRTILFAAGVSFAASPALAQNEMAPTLG
jgi:hypothetical protein